jgi:DNA-binding beta-propeller fold protein YncE
MMVMKRKVARTVAGISAALCLAGLATAANASAAPAPRPAWRINTVTNKAGKPIAAGPGAENIIITPNGKTAYVACIASGTVVPITIATNKAQPAIRIGTGPDDMASAITP